MSSPSPMPEDPTPAANGGEYVPVGDAPGDGPQLSSWRPPTPDLCGTVAAFFQDLFECIRGVFQCVTALGQCCSPLFKCAWECVQFFTPLTVTVVFLWLIYRPDRFRPHVDSAVLAAFDLAPPASNVSGASLRYDLSVDLSFKNSHHYVGIHYLDIGATAFYNGTRLGSADQALPAFYQGPGNTTVVHPTFRDVAGNYTAAAVAGELAREAAAGTLHLQVRVALTLMYKVWFEKAVFFYKYDCWMWFPPPRNGTPAVFRAGTDCWPAK